MQREITRWLAMITFIFTITGCDSGGGGSSASSDSFIQVTNAIPDSPALTITIDVDVDNDGSEEETTSIQSFRQALGKQDKTAGELVFSVTHGDDVTLIGETTLALQADTLHTLILTGSYESPEYLLLEKPVGDVDDDDSEQAEIQIVHLGSGGALDVYMSDTLAASDIPIVTLSPGGISEPILMTGANEYDFRLTDAGTDRVVFDPGTVTFAERNRYTVIITDEHTTYSTNTSAYILNENGVTQTFQNLVNKPRLRFFNGIPDELSIEIDYADYFNADQVHTISLDFREVSDYIELELSSVFVEISGRLASAPGTSVFSTVISVDSDTYYTLIIAGSITDDTISTQLADTDERVTATLARAQFVNAAKITVLDDDKEEQLTLSFDLLKVGESLEDVSPVVSALGFLAFKSAIVETDPSLAVAEETSTGDIVAGPVPVLIGEKSSLLFVVTEADGGGLPLKLSVYSSEDG